MHNDYKNQRQAWSAPKLQRLPASNAEGNGGTKGDGQQAQPRS